MTNAPGHTEHNDTCMSEWAEKAHQSVKMTPETVAENHRLHMGDVWFLAGKDKEAPRPAVWPDDKHGWCGYMLGMDVQYETTPDSVLHHSNACPIHGRKMWPNADDAVRVRMDKVNN